MAEKKRKILTISLDPEVGAHLDNLAFEMNKASSQLAAELISIGIAAREEEEVAREKVERQQRAKQTMILLHQDINA